jgi:hypothetical protein
MENGMPYLACHGMQVHAYLLKTVYACNGKCIVHNRGCDDHCPQHNMYAAACTIFVSTVPLGGRNQHAHSQNEVCNK